MSALHRAVRVEALEAFAAPWELRHAFGDRPAVLLENPGVPSELGRYAFLGGDPFLEFEVSGGMTWVGTGDMKSIRFGNPLDILAGLLARYRCDHSPWREGMPPFLGGVMGYLGYELLTAVEPTVRLSAVDELGVPEASLLFCGSVVAADLLAQRAWRVTQAFHEVPAEAESCAEALMARLRERTAQRAPEVYPGGLKRPEGRLSEVGVRSAGFVPRVTREDYEATVEQAKADIRDGTVFEVCTSQRFDGVYAGTGERLYAALRALNPAPFAAWVRLPGLEVACSSPERFVRLDRAGWAQTRPIKGTRPRGATEAEDARLRAELAEAEKDRAENLMIVDLARNDLGRVCAFGTVRVPGLCEVEAHPFTSQLVSTVVGKLREGLSAVDLVRAAFPGGSMTGAPKVEAMRRIDALEPARRGVFSGSIGYVDWDGAMDLNIVIRTLVKQGERVSFSVGGAVVADSDAHAEYRETLDKAHALVAAVETARGA
ncbi:MAG: anthranilate synthase component I family protein [Deltaproteobacteria bacterium]|nr:anthranilate synthase component I family protein [Deltaproteobacteria bacterium]